ncbi:MAG: hypothetical protein KatS3mg105_2799 [Gemmatales bacterium]|nr:MAG: hypothetical protein KatS3mg105_2799 [Gemmatales bacterium]
MERDRNLLFGAIAMQLALIDAKQFADACASWAVSQDRTLGDVLRERGWISDNDYKQIEELLNRKLEKHGGDVRHTLTAVTSNEFREALQSISDQEIRHSIIAPGNDSQDLVSTLCLPVHEQGRYSLIRLYAEGGLGQIYVARDRILNREVALKEIKPRQAAQPDARRRFLREAQITGQLEHPNIVPVYELSYRPEDDRPFYTMRLVRGRTLHDAIEDYHRRVRDKIAEPLEQVHLLEAFISVCRAVAYAHSRGVVHRDLKPENVLLGEFGEVVVLDWGLAKMINQPEDSEFAHVGVTTEDSETHKTAAGRVLGTPAYMAPEQAEGRVDQIDIRTDIYGLGAILFEIVAGVAPHKGPSSAEVLRRIISGPSPRPDAVNRNVPAPLNAICKKAMAKARSDRYQRATDLADDVRRYLADKPISVYRAPWTERVAQWGRHHRTTVFAGLTALFAVIATSVLFAVQMAQLADKERQARLDAVAMRDQGIQVAARFAARTIAAEMDLRWRILEAEATDPLLQQTLEQAKRGPVSEEATKKLQKWLEKRHAEHSTVTKAESWFVNDANGIQLARSPHNPHTIGETWAFRDYFHGRGYDLPRNQSAPPISDVHCSIVFQSKATGDYMVAFSVPVRSNLPDDKKSVIGVLAMTVTLGDFTALQLGLRTEQLVVLVDTRNDAIEQKSGLIMHHPLLASRQVDGNNVPYRLPPSFVQKMLRQSAERYVDEGSAVILMHDYLDPVTPGRHWLAAYEPVIVKGRPAKVANTGWFVIIQEPADDSS